MANSKKINSKIETIYELSSMQEGMLYHKLLDEKHDNYFVQNVLVLNSYLDQTNIRASLKLLAEKYEALRTMVFYRKAQKPRLIVLKDREIEFNVIDSKADDKSLPVYKSADMDRGFDLEKDSLMRVTYVEYSNSSAMIWSFHHIIMDGWCLSIILNDFIRFYEALSNKASYQKLLDEVLLEKKSIPSYGALAAWKKRQNSEVSMSYWNNLLADFDTATVIQPDVTEDNSDTSDMYVLKNFDCKQSVLVEQFAKKSGVTVSNVVEAAYGIVLQKYMNTPDVVFGKVVSGRNADILGIESAVGLFINTIPVRVTTNDSMTCKELLRNVMIESVESTSHDYCPLVDIQQQTIVGKNLINSLLVYENYFIDKYPESISNISFSVDEQVEGTNYPITLSVHFTDRLELKIMYKSNMFSATFIEKLLNQIYTVILTIVSAPHMRVQEIELMSADEKEKILSTFNDTFAQYSHLSLPELFEAVVKANESKTALVTSSEILSYRELNNRANIIADTLSTKGIVSGDTVAILLNRTANLIAAVLGVLKVGACYLPIDPEFPVERINYIVDNSSAKCVITEKDNVGKIVNTIDVVDVHQFDYSVNSQYHGDYCELFEYSAYCIYTSGSTGNPKGVYVSHKNISNLIQWQLRTQNYSTERILASTKITFDVATQEIMFALLGGKTLILTPDGLKENIADFLSFANEHCADTMFTTPSYLDVVCSNESNAKQLTGTVKTFILAGEAFYINSILKHYVGKKGYTFINQYGPSETHVATSAIIDDVSNVTIGKPIDNAKIYILDNSNRLSSIGMIGELCIAGDCVGLGYANMPELTEQKFTVFAETNEKIYRTGDLARWLPDGCIDYIGRNDFQVKIRGLRVELEEIEKKLIDIPGVQNALVLVKKDANGMQYICAYYAGNPEIDETTIKNKLSLVLPQYMIPNAIMRLDTIPLNNNGKIDRTRLPEIQIQSSVDFIAPETEIEKQIASLFAQILDVEKVGLLDDFFELGGHSLKATLLVNRIEELVGRRISVKDLFAHSTVRELCAYIATSTENSNSYEAIPVVENKDYYEASFAQRRLYVMDQIDETGVAYNMPAAFRILGHFDLERANVALKRIVERHDVMRTSFSLLDDTIPVQYIQDSVDAQIDFYDYSEREVSSCEEIISSFVKPFELNSAPLIRVTVVKLSNDDHIILFDIHHIIADGVTLQLIIKEFNDLYAGKELADVTIQYKDYSEWQRSLDMTQQEEFWLSQFDGEIPVLNLPLDYNRPLTQKFEGACERCVLSGELNQKINSFCHGKKITPYMLFLSSAMILLSKYSMQEDIIMGSSVSGRTHKDTEYMLGMFVNTVALRGFPKQEKTCNDFLNEIHQLCLKMYENQDYPFQKLVEQLKLERTPSRNPLFDVMFTFQNTGDAGLAFADAEIESFEISNAAKFDLTL